MSESDDTDVLLLIPPDIFHVPSSNTSSSGSPRTDCGKTGVISELVGHMQSLDSRISAIESRDNSILDVSVLNNSLDSQQVYGSASYPCYRQTLPRLSVSQSTSLQNTPVKFRKPLSVPSTPSGYSTRNNHANSLKNDTKSGCLQEGLLTAATSNFTTTTNIITRAKHDTLTSYSDSFVVPSTCCGTELSHATAISVNKESLSLCPNDCSTSNLYYKPYNFLSSAPSASNLPNTSIGQKHTRTRIVQEMELSEVDELLQEMEATELELSKRINSSNRYQYYKELAHPKLLSQTIDAANGQEKETQHKIGAYKKLNFLSCSTEPQLTDTLSAFTQKKSNNAFPDITLSYGESFQLNEPDKIISEFKTWEQPISKANEHTIENSIKNTDHLSNVSSATINNAKSKDLISNQNVARSEASTSNIHVQSNNSTANSLFHVSESTKFSDVMPSRAAQFSNTEHLLDPSKTPQHNGNVHDDREKSVFAKSAVHVATNTDSQLRKCQRILSLSDFWEMNPARSQEETFRIKLEEEKYRREHCEHLIQELQKRLLEQQEKVAVAVKIDTEKNVLISQFHTAWSKLKQQVALLEVEHKNSQTNLQNVTEKHQSEISELQTQIKRLEEKLSKTLDLAAGYKEKSDTMIKEKVDLLKTHADELESYKLLVQEAENRYEQIKIELNKLLEKNQQNEETLQTVQSELNKERLRGSEVRNEMGVIHKALDTCEAELTVLRQEKENLQLKLKEEINRNSILEQKNSSLLVSIDDAKKAEKLARDETKSIVEQKEKIRAELQEVYQKQVDEVVKAKLQEFQTQLDNAESEFLEELKTRQQVIAECAARKIKDVIDKHRLEINLLEEKHKEEKRLCELQLAQALQRSSMLETHLNSQRTSKSQLAEQLHSVMQKQWQQALQIISGDNTNNLSPLQKIYANKHFDSKNPRKSESMPNCYSKLSQEPIKYTTQSLETQNPIQLLEDQNESVITMNSSENTPVTSKKESKNDLRKYVKMIAEMQLAKEDRDPKPRNSISSPPLECREVPRKHYLKKELSIMSEDSIMWQPTSETSYDVSEHILLPQKMITKLDQQRSKPPWK